MTRLLSSILEELQPNKLRKYDIWSEGYICTGMEGIPAKARQLASGVEATSFEEAVKKWYSSVEDASSLYGNLSIYNGRIFIYGCELFDNERDAQKAFG